GEGVAQGRGRLDGDVGRTGAEQAEGREGGRHEHETTSNQQSGYQISSHRSHHSQPKPGACQETTRGRGKRRGRRLRSPAPSVSGLVTRPCGRPYGCRPRERPWGTTSVASSRQAAPLT